MTMLFDTTRWNLSIVQFNLKMDKSHLDSVFVLQLKDILQIDNGNGQGKPFNVTVLLNVVQLKFAIDNHGCLTKYENLKYGHLSDTLICLVLIILR